MNTPAVISAITPSTQLTPELNAQIIPALAEIANKLDTYEVRQSEMQAMTGKRDELSGKKHILAGIAGFFAGCAIGVIVGKLGFIFGILGNAGPVVGVIAAITIAKKKTAALIDELEPKINAAAAEVRQLEQELSAYTFLPPEMMHSWAVNKLAEIIRYNRAETWKEAVGVLSDEAHKAYMEGMTEMALANSEAAKNAAGAAAAGAGLAAGASILGALFKS